MGEPRIIVVQLTDGSAAKVRVLTQHPEDDAANRDLYRAAALWGWADKQEERATIETDATKALAMIEQVVTAKMQRDHARREVVKVALRRQHNDSEIEEILRKCSPRDYLLIFNAAQNEEPNALISDWLIKQVQALALTPAELLGLCYSPEQLGSLLAWPTSDGEPTVT